VTMTKLNRGQPCQFVTGETDQGLYLVPQLQSASNLFMLAVEELEELGALGLQGAEALEHTASVLQNTWDLLRRAREELHARSRASFPRNGHPSTVFRPELPPDLALDFQVDAGDLVVAAHALGPSSAPGKNTDAGATEGAVMAGQVVQHKGQWVEVLQTVEHRYEIRQLHAACDALERAWHITNRTRDHLVAIQHSAAM
jgi:hypothetical protein